MARPVIPFRCLAGRLPEDTTRIDNSLDLSPESIGEGHYAMIVA